jgi:hypothetical protein
VSGKAELPRGSVVVAAGDLRPLVVVRAEDAATRPDVVAKVAARAGAKPRIASARGAARRQGRARRQGEGGHVGAPGRCRAGIGRGESSCLRRLPARRGPALRDLDVADGP